MAEEELRDRILHREHLEPQESTPAASDDPSFDMTEDELRRYYNFLYQQLLDKDRMNELILSELRAIKASQGKARTESLHAHSVSRVHADRLLSEISDLRNQLMSAHKEITLLLKENRDLRDALGVANGNIMAVLRTRKASVSSVTLRAVMTVVMILTVLPLFCSMMKMHLVHWMGMAMFLSIRLPMVKTLPKYTMVPIVKAVSIINRL